MSENSGIPDDGTTDSLVASLGVADGVVRWGARQRLLEIGKPAVPALVKALASPEETVRWEAAKALGDIRDPGAAPALIDAMEDTSASVRWLAAKGLTALGRGALIPLLQALERCADNIWMQNGAQQVLRTLVKDGLADEALPILEALGGIEPAVETPVSAYRVLEELQKKVAQSLHVRARTSFEVEP